MKQNIKWLHIIKHIVTPITLQLLADENMLDIIFHFKDAIDNEIILKYEYTKHTTLYIQLQYLCQKMRMIYVSWYSILYNTILWYIITTPNIIYLQYAPLICNTMIRLFTGKQNRVYNIQLYSMIIKSILGFAQKIHEQSMVHIEVFYIYYLHRLNSIYDLNFGYMISGFTSYIQNHQHFIMGIQDKIVIYKLYDYNNSYFTITLM